MSNQRNLIILSFDYPPSTGGVARLCHEITLGLQKYYNYIKVITVDKNGIHKPYNVNKEIEIIKVPARRGYCELETVKILRRLENKESYDVICGLWHPEAFLARLAGMKHIFVLAHGAELLPGASRLRKYLWLPIYGRSILNNVKKVITNSGYTKDLVKKISSSTMVSSLPLGVDHIFFSPSQKLKKSSNVIKFCTVARILDFKGHDFVLNTFENLPEDLRSRIEWHIAGTGAHESRLKGLIENSVIKNQVKMHGYIPDKDLPDFYRHNDIFILATREQEKSNQVEGFGLVFLEAQSSALPAIGTRTGGISDAIDEGNGGWLFEQDNSDSLVSILRSILTSPQLIEEQSLKARERVLRHCTWEIYCDKLHNIITA